MGSKTSKSSTCDCKESNIATQPPFDEPPPPYSVLLLAEAEKTQLQQQLITPHPKQDYAIFALLEKINMTQYICYHWWRYGKTDMTPVKNEIKRKLCILPVAIDLYVEGKRLDSLKEEINRNLQVVTSSWGEGKKLSMSFGDHTLQFVCSSIVYKNVRVLAALICLKDLIQCRDALPDHILKSRPLGINYDYVRIWQNSKVQVEKIWTDVLNCIWKPSKDNLECHCKIQFYQRECFIMLDPTVLLSFTDVGGKATEAAAQAEAAIEKFF